MKVIHENGLRGCAPNRPLCGFATTEYLSKFDITKLLKVLRPNFNFLQYRPRML